MPNEIDERISVVAYDPRWPSWYTIDAEELSRALGTWLREEQHFGGTSVPETAAKPIIDILVAPVECPLAATDRLERSFHGVHTERVVELKNGSLLRNFGSGALLPELPT